MSRSFHVAALSAALFAAPQAFAQTHTIAIEGAFTTAETNTNSTGGPTYDIAPVPLNFSFTLEVDPDAPVTVTTFFGTRGEQVHFSDTTQSAAFSAPHSYLQPALSEWQARLGDHFDASFSQANYEAWADPQYTTSTTKRSMKVATGGPEISTTSWLFNVTQTWRSDGLPSPHGGETLTEAWGSSLVVELVRPAAYTEADVAEPMSSDDLSSFLDGFEEAGGTVRVLSEAGWARFVTTIPEAGDDSEIYLTGDFQLADMSTVPIPEPSTYALLAVGLGVLVWRTRRRFHQ
jgi:hypothetical protein